MNEIELKSSKKEKRTSFNKNERNIAKVNSNDNLSDKFFESFDKEYEKQKLKKEQNDNTFKINNNNNEETNDKKRIINKTKTVFMNEDNNEEILFSDSSKRTINKIKTELPKKKINFFD